MNDNASINFRKMDDGTIDVFVVSAFDPKVGQPAGLINMPADVFAILVREISDPAFSSFNWTPDSV